VWVAVVLAAALVVGAAVQGLGVTGSLDRSTFPLAAALVPCLLLGFVVSRLPQRVVPAHHIRGGVLLVCGAPRTGV